MELHHLIARRRTPASTGTVGPWSTSIRRARSAVVNSVAAVVTPTTPWQTARNARRRTSIAKEEEGKWTM